MKGRPLLAAQCITTGALIAIVCMGGCGGGGTTITPTPIPVPQTLRGAAQQHNLLMGTAADSAYLGEPLYASTLAGEYSQLEPENEIRFGLLYPQPTTYAYSSPDGPVAFAQANSIKVRGHNLVWFSQLPFGSRTRPLPAVLRR